MTATPPPPPREPFDAVKGAFIVLVLLVCGLVLATSGILAGCFYGIAPLCEKGSGVNDVTQQIITVLAIILGARRPPPIP